MSEEKNLVITKKTLWTVPNILTFIRILCVPAIMALVILGGKAGQFVAGKSWMVYTGLGIMVFAAFTDVLDGKIARRWPSQGTYVGQVLDPIADKAMHIGAMLALCISGFLHWAFLGLIIFRELCMVVIGAIFVNDANIKANMMGKVASTFVSVGIIASFFHPWMFKAWNHDFAPDWIVVAIGIALNWWAAVNYGIEYIPQFIKSRKAANLAQNNEAVEVEVEVIEPVVKTETVDASANETDTTPIE